MQPNQVDQQSNQQTTPPIVTTGSRPDISLSQSIPNPQMNLSVKKHKYLKGLLVVLLCELLIGGGLAAYFWRDGQAMEQQAKLEAQIQELQTQVTELSGETNDETIDTPTDEEVDILPTE